MATPNRFAVRDIDSATFFNLQTGKVITTLNTLKSTGIENTGDTVYAMGGAGNSKLVGFSSNKAAKLAIQDALWDKDAIGMITGNGVIDGAKVVNHNEVLTADGTNTITLSKTPTGTITGVYLVNADGTNGKEQTLGTPASVTDEYSITAKVITLNATSAPQGTKVRVYYKVTTASDAKTMSVTTNAFGGTFKIVLDALVRDSLDGNDYAAQITVPRGKFEEGFSMNLAVEGDPSVLDMPIECLKDPLTNELWTMVVYNEDTIV